MCDKLSIVIHCLVTSEVRWYVRLRLYHCIRYEHYTKMCPPLQVFIVLRISQAEETLKGENMSPSLDFTLSHYIAIAATSTRAVYMYTVETFHALFVVYYVIF